jgi:hypothetical protein
MIRIFKSILLLVFAMFATGCTDHTAPTESEVKAFFLQSSTFASAVDEGRLKLNTFKITSGKSRKVADQELYKAKFVANISISPLACTNQPDVDCGADTVQTREITGTAEFEWDSDNWSKAGLVLDQ